MDAEGARGIDRRRLVTWGGLAAADLVRGQWVYQRAGGDPGAGANGNPYPDTGWVGVILANSDGAPPQDMIAQELQAITGHRPAGGRVAEA